MKIKKTLKIIANLLGIEIKRLKTVKKFQDEYLMIPRAGLTYSTDLLFTYHNADFLQDPDFIESYNLGKQTDTGRLLTNNDFQWRIHILCTAAYHAKHLEGDFVDCGVHTGIFARAIINYTNFQDTKKKYYLLDTFRGMDPKYSSKKDMERHISIGYGTENEETLYQNVSNTFRNFNVEIIKGSVPETLHLVKSEKICFLSVDMNCVEPEIKALEYFWNKMVTGGVILLDDYGYANSTNDQKAAHDKFAFSKGVKIFSLPTCQGLLIKP